MKSYLISYFYTFNLDPLGLTYRPVENYGDTTIEATNKLSQSDVEMIREKIKTDNDFEKVVILNIIELRGERK